MPAWRQLLTDFPNYYLAAKAYRGGYPLEHLYDWIWIQRQKDHAGLDQPFVGYVPLTLFSALLIAPLASLPALEAKRCWLIFNLLLLTAIGYLLRRMTRLPARRIALIVFLTIVPLRTSFQFGQQHLFILFLLTLAAWLYFEGRLIGAGAVVAVAGALKLYPALFLLLFLRKRQWRALFGLLSASIALGVVGLVSFGVEPLRVYVLEVLPRAVLRAEVTDPYTVHLSSFTGLLRRLLVYEPELNPHPLAHAPALFAFLQPLIAASIFIPGLWLLTPGRADPARQKLDWGIWLGLVLLLSSGTASYHLCVLILASALVLDYLLNEGRVKQARALLVLYGVVCLPYYGFFPASPEGWTTLAGYPRVYAMTAFCSVLAWASRPVPPPPADRFRRRETAVFALAFVAMVALGTISNLRHLRGQFSNYAQRVLLPTSSLMATDPAPAGDEVYFARMDEEGFVADRIGRPLRTAVGPGTDLFHPTLTPDGRQGWIEVASTRSSVARFSRDAAVLPVANPPSEIVDAEQPVISADGRWLGFLREHDGRRGLWRMALGAGEPDGAPARPPERLVGPDVDVLEFGFFPDDRIVLSARRGGRARLFAIGPPGWDLVELPISDRAARYPAVSPDGRFIAYAREEHGSWQLWTTSLDAGARRRLTDGDCNSVRPAWVADSRRIVYATDCGRGLGHTALARLVAVP